jgi:hypothetical protein
MLVIRESELYIWTVEHDAIYFGDVSVFLDEHTTNTAGSSLSTPTLLRAMVCVLLINCLALASRLYRRLSPAVAQLVSLE